MFDFKKREKKDPKTKHVIMSFPYIVSISYFSRAHVLVSDENKQFYMYLD